MSAIASRFEQHSVQHYAREVRGLLPPEVLQPVPAQLWWLPVHLAIIGGLAAVVVLAQPAWYVALACALIAGHSWACLGFLAHEVLHHAVVRNRTVERLVGYCGLVIFCLSPTLWIAWHNQQHHGHTGDPDADPDHFGTLETWRASAADHNTPTDHWDEGIKDPVSRLQVETLDANIRDFGALADGIIGLAEMLDIGQHIAFGHGLPIDRKSRRSRLHAPAISGLHPAARVRIDDDGPRQFDRFDRLGFLNDLRANAHAALCENGDVHAAVG